MQDQHIPENPYTRDQMLGRAIKAAVFSSRPNPTPKQYRDSDIDVLLSFAKSHIDGFVTFAHIGYELSGSDCDALILRVKEQLSK